MSGGAAGEGAPRRRPTLEIREVEPALVRPLRAEVLRPGADPAELVYPGDQVPGAFHLAGYLPADPNARQAELVAIVSLSPEPMPEGGDARAPYRLRGMATARGIRGTGAGSALLAAALEAIGRRGGDRVWCNARTSAEGFYLQHGFRPRGGVFELPGIGPHRVMERTIPERSRGFQHAQTRSEAD